MTEESLAYEIADECGADKVTGLELLRNGQYRVACIRDGEQVELMTEPQQQEDSDQNEPF